MVGLGEARSVGARRGRRGKARQGPLRGAAGVARRGKTSWSVMRYDVVYAKAGKARRGLVRLGEARSVGARRGRRGMATVRQGRHGRVGQGVAYHGQAWHGRAGKEDRRH